MSTTISPAKRLQGRIHVPGDKSIAHRAVLLASVAEGVSRLEGLPTGADVGSSLDAVRDLGVEVEPLEREAVPWPAGPEQRAVRIKGIGSSGLRAPAGPIQCGNSGTTLRLLAGIIAGQSFGCTLAGDASLQRRPMRRIAEPLQAMGASVETSAEGTPPLRFAGIRGRLRAIEHRPWVASAQVKSCVLLAGLYADGPTAVIEPQVTRDHTERMLAEMGATVVVEDQGEGRRVRIEPGPTLDPLGGTIPGDLSSAAYFLAAVTLRPGSHVALPGVGVNPTRVRLLDLLREWGADVDAEPEGEWHGEPTATLQARGIEERLRGGVIGADDVPSLIDELPLLAALGPFTEQGVEIRGADELRVKESDRIAAMAAGLRALGAEVEELPDGLTVAGGTGLRGGTVEAAGDHRVALCFAAVAPAADGPVTIRGSEAMEVSYPGFVVSLDELAER